MTELHVKLPGIIFHFPTDFVVSSLLDITKYVSTYIHDSLCLKTIVKTGLKIYVKFRNTAEGEQGKVNLTYHSPTVLSV